MLLFRILSYLGGYVVLSVPEHCLEKFVNLAVARGIFLWDVTGKGAGRVIMKARLGGVQPLRHVARMTGCRFRILERHGLPFFIARMRQRRVMTAGAVLFVIALYMLSSFIWFIDVTGNKQVPAGEVERVARQSGVKPGALRWSVDEAALEKAILEQVPGLAWVGVYVDGTRVRIKVVERKMPPPDESGVPADVVAAKDGLVEEILVLSGHPLVKEGDTVSEGQVLISAAIPLPETSGEEEEDENFGDVPEMRREDTVRLVHARGIVRARVWYENDAEQALVERGNARTGDEITRFGIKIGTKEIILMGPREIPFEHYAMEVDRKRVSNWRNINIPVELITVRYCEEKPYINRYSRDEAISIAGRHAMDEIRRQLPAGARILGRNVEELELLGDPNLIKVRVIVEVLEDIGVEKPHQYRGGGTGVVDDGERGRKVNHR